MQNDSESDLEIEVSMDESGNPVIRVTDQSRHAGGEWVGEEMPLPYKRVYRQGLDQVDKQMARLAKVKADRQARFEARFAELRPGESIKEDELPELGMLPGHPIFSVTESGAALAVAALQIGKLELGENDILVVRVSEELCTEYEKIRETYPEAPSALAQIEAYFANAPAMKGKKILIIDKHAELSVIKCGADENVAEVNAPLVRAIQRLK